MSSQVSFVEMLRSFELMSRFTQAITIEKAKGIYFENTQSKIDCLQDVTSSEELTHCVRKLSLVDQIAFIKYVISPKADHVGTTSDRSNNDETGVQNSKSVTISFLNDHLIKGGHEFANVESLPDPLKMTSRCNIYYAITLATSVIKGTVITHANVKQYLDKDCVKSHTINTAIQFAVRFTAEVTGLKCALCANSGNKILSGAQLKPTPNISHMIQDKFLIVLHISFLRNENEIRIDQELTHNCMYVFYYKGVIFPNFEGKAHRLGQKFEQLCHVCYTEELAANSPDFKIVESTIGDSAIKKRNRMLTSYLFPSNDGSKTSRTIGYWDSFYIYSDQN